MKIKTISYLLFCILAITPLLPAQEQTELNEVPEYLKTGFDSITAEDSRSYVEFFASDELEGRNTSSQGLKIAKNYIISLYKSWGVAPLGDKDHGGQSYSQMVPLMEVIGDPVVEIILAGNGKKKVLMQDISFYTGRSLLEPGELSAPVVFAGYGFTNEDKTYDDFANLDVKGKIVLLMQGYPGGSEGPYAPENENRWAMFMRMRQVGQTLAEKGAIALVYVNLESTPDVDDNFIQGDTITAIRRQFHVPALRARRSALPSVTLNKQGFNDLCGVAAVDLNELKNKIDTTLKPQSQALEGVSLTLNSELELKPSPSYNVLGFIEGSDETLKNEYVVVGAHYDHLGMSELGHVFNGADDNASGSAGVLEVAQAFAMNKVKPKRSIIFAHWTGEEKGLYGSRYFVENPTIPRENIVAYINFDMLSRDMSVEAATRMSRRWNMTIPGMEINDENLKKLMIGLCSSQGEGFADLVRSMNDKYVGLIFPIFERADNAGGSDHAPFHIARIPNIFFYCGMTDDYHTPRDTIEKINPVKMQKSAQVAYLVLFGLANAENRMQWKDN